MKCCFSSQSPTVAGFRWSPAAWVHLPCPQPLQGPPRRPWSCLSPLLWTGQAPFWAPWGVSLPPTCLRPHHAGVLPAMLVSCLPGPRGRVGCQTQYSRVGWWTCWPGRVGSVEGGRRRLQGISHPSLTPRLQAPWPLCSPSHSALWRGVRGVERAAPACSLLRQ